MTRGRKLLAGAGTALLLAAVFAPPFLARRVLRRLRLGDASLSVQRVGGNLIRGVVLEGVTYEAPGVSVSARRVVARLSWHSLLRRHLSLDKLSVDSPRVAVDPALARPAKSREAGGGWTVSVKRFALKDGALKVTSASGTYRVDGLSARGSWRRDTLALERFTARLPGLELGARGRVSASTTALVVTLTGETTGQALVSGAPGVWRFSGHGVWRGAPWTAGASLSGEDWTAVARLESFDLSRAWPPARGRLAPLTLAAAGEGRGLDDKLTARLRLSAEERGGARLDGAVDASSGTARFSVVLSSGASGAAEGEAGLADGSLRARWSMNGDGLARRFGVEAAALRAKGAVRGSFDAPRWTASASLRGLSIDDFRARAASLEASGEGGLGTAAASVAGARQGPLRVRRARARFAGTLDEHHVDFSVDAGSVAAAGQARGGLSGDAWSGRVEELSLSKPRTMKSERPFGLAFSFGRGAGLTVDGLALSGEREARLELTARKRGGRWPKLSARVLCDLMAAYDLGLMRSPVAGRVDAAVDLSGDIHAPSGTVSLDISHAKFAEIDAGSATVRLSLDGRLAHVQKFDWQLGRGRAVLSGTLPLRLGGPSPADFALRAQAQRLSLAAFARRLTAVQFTGPRVDADLTLRRASGRFALEGGGRVDLEAAAVPSAGLSFGPSSAELAARGDRLEVTRSALTPAGKGAKAALSGALTPEGPELRLTAERLRLDTGRGLTAEADGDVSLAGTWRAPAVNGTVRPRRADLAPLTAKQKKRIDEQQRAAAEAAAAKAADEAAERASPASVDLRFVWDGNAWFKDKATSIELKGDVRLRKKPYDLSQLLGTVETVRGDYVYFSRVFKIESGSLKLAGDTPMDALLNARGLYVDDATRIKVHLILTGTLDQPKMTLTSEPPMDERDIVSFLVTGRPLYEVAGVEAKQVGGTAEAASVVADYLSQGLRRYLPPQLALDVFRLEVKRGAPGMTVGRYITRRLFVSYGQTAGSEGERKVDATYTLSPHWSVETQSVNQRAGATTSGTNGATDTIVDLLFSFGFK